MIFKLIFKKRIAELEKKELEIEKRKISIPKEISELEKKLEFEKKRFQRIKFILNERVNPGVRCLIDTSKDGTTIINAINLNENEIDVFDIDNTDVKSKESGAWAKLWPQMRVKQIFIQDRQNTPERGFVESAMKNLLSIAEENSRESLDEHQKSDKFYNDKKKMFNLYQDLGFRIKYFPEEKSEMKNKEEQNNQ